MDIPLMAIQLPDTDDFSTCFNYVGRLFQKCNDDTLSEEERKKWEKEYGAAKYCLEQGLPIAFLDTV